MSFKNHEDAPNMYVILLQKQLLFNTVIYKIYDDICKKKYLFTYH